MDNFENNLPLNSIKSDSILAKCITVCEVHNTLDLSNKRDDPIKLTLEKENEK